MRIYPIVLILAIIVLNGCIPYPHTTERFPAMQGRVVDAVTDQPVADAIVAIHDHPGTNIKTDPNGYFHFSERRNHHLGVTVGMCGSDWPTGTNWSNTLDVSATNYIRCKINASDLIASSHEPYQLKDIKLTPNPK